MTAASGRRDGARAVVSVVPSDDVVKLVVIAMGKALASPARIKDGPINMIESNRHVAQAGADALIAASPSAGSISAEDLERAAEAQWNSSVAAFNTMPKWHLTDDATRAQCIKDQRAAFEAAGLTVAPAAPQVFEDWVRDQLDASKPLPPHKPASKGEPS